MFLSAHQDRPYSSISFTYLAHVPPTRSPVTTKWYFWMIRLYRSREKFPFKTNHNVQMVITVTSLARTWEYSMSSSYSVSMWSLVNAIGTKRMFFLPLSQSPLMVSSVWGPSQGIGPTCEKGEWTHTGTPFCLVSVTHHSPPPWTHAHTLVRVRARLYICVSGLCYIYIKLEASQKLA